MKLSAQSLTILKNFSTINGGIVIREGNFLKTISTNKTIIAEATLPDSFSLEAVPAGADGSKAVAIYDLSKVLGVLSLHDNAEVVFADHYLALSGGRGRTRVRYSDISLILQPPERPLNIPSYELKFNLTQDDLAWISQVGSVLKAPNLVVSGTGSAATISAVDVKGALVDDAKIDIKTSSGDVYPDEATSYSFAVKVENLHLVPDTYTVEFSKKNVVKFTGHHVPVVYYVSLEKAHSKIG